MKSIKSHYFYSSYDDNSQGRQLNRLM